MIAKWQLSTVIVGGMVLLTVMAGAVQASLDLGQRYSLLVALVGVVVLLYMVKHPEISFVLFFNAGAFKADPRLALPGSLDLTLVLFLVSVVGALVRIFGDKEQWELPRARLLVPYMVMASIATISLLYTQSPVYGQDKLLRFLSLTSFSLLGPWFIFRNDRDFRRCFVVYVLLSLILTADMYLSGSAWYHFRAFSAGYSKVGNMSGQSVIMVARYQVQNVSNSSVWRLTLLGLAIYLFLATGATAGRSGFLILVAILLGLMMVLLRRSRSSIATRMMGSNISPATVRVMFLSLAASVVLFSSQFELLVHRLLVLLDLAKYEPQRISMYGVALNGISTLQDVLIGVGIGGFSALWRGVGDRSIRGAFPHNLIVEVGIELGVIGLAGLLLLFNAALRALGKMYKDKRSDLYIVDTLGAMFVFQVLFYMFNGDLNDARELFAWIGMIIAYHQVVSSMPDSVATITKPNHQYLKSRPQYASIFHR